MAGHPNKRRHLLASVLIRSKPTHTGSVLQIIPHCNRGDRVEFLTKNSLWTHEYDGISPFCTFKKALSTTAGNTKQVLSRRIPNTESTLYVGMVSDSGLGVLFPIHLYMHDRSFKLFTYVIFYLKRDFFVNI